MTAPQVPDSSPSAPARSAPPRVAPDRSPADRVAPTRPDPARTVPGREHAARASSSEAPAGPSDGGQPTTRQAAVTDDAGGPPTTRQPAVADDGRVRRPGPPRPPVARGTADRPGATKPQAGRTRQARLALKRIDPWSVFLFSLLASVFMGIALVVAVFALFTVLDALGVVSSINELVGEVTGETAALLTTSRLVGGAAVLGAVNVVLLTLLATLGAVLYNLCASLTGGIELTLGERDG